MWWRLAFPLLFFLAPRLIPRLARNVYLVWKLTLDSRVPLLLKLLVPMALIYFVVPVGLIPDLLPFGVGLIEDVLLLLLAVWMLLHFAPQDVVAEYAPWRTRTRAGQNPVEKDPSRVVEGSYQLIDEEESNK